MLRAIEDNPVGSAEFRLEEDAARVVEEHARVVEEHSAGVIEEHTARIVEPHAAGVVERGDSVRVERVVRGELLGAFEMFTPIGESPSAALVESMALLPECLLTVEADKPRSASYARLPAGDYRFRVKACNNDGVWNEQGASLQLVVAPFFYNTWWFRLLLLAALVYAAPYVRDNTQRALLFVIGLPLILVPGIWISYIKTEGGWRWRGGD